MGIFITMFMNQMGDGNYYPILKVNSNSSQYGVTSPMADRRTDFNNMSEWLDSWRQKEFSWELLWEDFVKVCEGYIGKSVTFLDSSKTLDEQVVRMRQEFSFLENIEWVEGEGATDKTVDMELMISPHNSIFRIGDPDVDIRYTSTYPQISRIQINHLAGDSTTVDGVLRADNIEPATNGGTVKIGSADIGEFRIGGQKISPNMSTTTAKMDYTLESYTLYPLKCIIGSSVESLDPIKLVDGSDNKNPPLVYVDSNFCGEVRFVTVRPIILDNTKLHDRINCMKSTCRIV